MAARTITNQSIVTQTLVAVAAMLKFFNRPTDPMPVYVELKNNIRLTKSKKGDCYYTTSLTDCSCKAHTFNPGTPCKHMKALQGAQEQATAPTLENGMDIMAHGSRMR